MNTFTLLNRCRVVITKVYHPLIKTLIKSHTSRNILKPSTNVVINTRSMSQTNITSFFKKTPKKASVEENNTTVSSVNNCNTILNIKVYLLCHILSVPLLIISNKITGISIKYK